MSMTKTSTVTVAGSSVNEPASKDAWKVSRYTLVSSDRFRVEGRSEVVRLVWNTFSGKTTVVEDTVAEDLSQGAVPSAVADRTWDALLRAHIVAPTDEDERAGVLQRLRNGASDRHERTFVLMPTAACNMGCSYCGQVHRKGDSGEEHRDLIRRRVSAAIADPQVRKLTVRWFGGEPLLAYRHVLTMGSEFFSAVRAAGKAYESRIVTNGALLSPQRALRLHREAGIQLFNITIDGPAAVHDSRRVTKSGRPTFWRIMSTLKGILQAKGAEQLRLQLRTNVDEHNVDSIAEYLRTCADVGLSDPRVLFELAPVHSWSNDADGDALSSASFAEREIEFYELMLNLGLNFPPLPSRPKRVTCPAVTLSAEILSPTGGSSPVLRNR